MKKNDEYPFMGESDTYDEDVLAQPRLPHCPLCDADHPSCLSDEEIEDMDNYLDKYGEGTFDGLDFTEPDEYELDVDPWEDYE